MSAVPLPMESICLVSDKPPVPFATVYATLTKQEHIRLVMEATSWKSLHRKATERAEWNERRHQHELLKLKLQAAQCETALRAELELAHAKVRDLHKRLFGRKSESRGGGSQGRPQAPVARARRGHQRGAPGHGRTMQPHLPQRIELVGLDSPQCPQCGLALGSVPGTEDSQVLEIEVKAYRRVIRRQRYRPLCDCGCVSGIVTAPPPPRLIERGKYGVSVWTSVLLDKFLYGRPSHRLLQDLADHGLNMSPGTLAGGLQALAPVLEPLNQALLGKLRSEAHWHADETRWAVFVTMQGKVGHRWYLWVFHSASVVHYVLDRSRSTKVVQGELEGVDRGIITCDRHAAYKRFARLNPGVLLAFCWSHQRRDYLELANSYPLLLPWAMQWVDAIGELYHLNGQRLQSQDGSAERVERHAALQQAAQRLADERDTALADPLLAGPAAKVLQNIWITTRPNAMRAWLWSGARISTAPGCEWSGQLAATMYSLLMTVKLWMINARTWLSAYLQACADSGNQAPQDINAFVPWAMDEARLACFRVGATDVSDVIESIDSS